APVLPDEEAAELVRLGAEIESLYGLPMDIEWARAEGKFVIVQARPITALPEPEPAALIEWKLPKGKYVAMRNNIVELMADPLTPLFSTLGLTSINTSLGGLLTMFFGKPGIMPEDLIITVNEYAYYNGSIKPGPMLKILLNTGGILKRMFTGAVERWTDAGRPRYVATVEHWQATRWRELSATELLSAVRELSEAAIDAYGALVSGVIPAAWISEGLFTIVYNTLIKRRDDPTAPTYLMGFDSMPIRAEKSLYDLAE
ncbi:MAG: phosphoenolpyruvate synthase, partial [Pseudomonas stutzeri]|nr:phosphoenolpyruvate synthase [Stutzerimonas stutzeri]